MDFKKSLAVGITTLLFSINAHSTVLQIDWTGVITSSSDQLGNVFNNGTGANTGVGMAISGRITWTDPVYNLGAHNGTALYQLDLDSNTAYGVALADPFVSTFTIDGQTYTSELNLGSNYSLIQSDFESGASGDRFNFSSRNSGWNQVGDEVSGLSDHVAERLDLGLDLRPLLGANDLIDGTDPLQSFSWSVLDGDPMLAAGGSLWIQSDYWTNGTDVRWTGTQTNTLLFGRAGFSLTSLTATPLSPASATAVPEPGTLSLLALGLLGVVTGARRKRIRA